MRYRVSAAELLDVEKYSPEKRLEYFLHRAIESEEVWGLSNESGWVMKSENNRTILPVWPYEQMAANCTANEWKNYVAGAVSLEHFVYNLLPKMLREDICIEVLPTASKTGKQLKADELAEIFEGLLESGEYYLEG